MKLTVTVSDNYQDFAGKMVPENTTILSSTDCPMTPRHFTEYIIESVKFYGKHIEHIGNDKYVSVAKHTLKLDSMDSESKEYDAWIVRKVLIEVPSKPIPDKYTLYENMRDIKFSPVNLATELECSDIMHGYEPTDPVFHDEYDIIELLKKNGATVHVVLYNFSTDAIAFMKDSHR